MSLASGRKRCTAKPRGTAPFHRRRAPEGKHQLPCQTVWCSREDSNIMTKLADLLSFCDPGERRCYPVRSQMDEARVRSAVRNAVMLGKVQAEGGFFVLPERGKSFHFNHLKTVWCGREDSNFHGLSATTTSTLRVYQFRHDRTFPGNRRGRCLGRRRPLAKAFAPCNNRSSCALFYGTKETRGRKAAGHVSAILVVRFDDDGSR